MQRVAIAVCLSKEADIYLLDEPSAYLDVEQRLKLERDIDFQEKILNQLKQMQKIDTLNADQVYQIKEELKQLKNQRQ